MLGIIASRPIAVKTFTIGPSNDTSQLNEFLFEYAGRIIDISYTASTNPKFNQFVNVLYYANV